MKAIFSAVMVLLAARGAAQAAGAGPLEGPEESVSGAQRVSWDGAFKRQAGGSAMAQLESVSVGAAVAAAEGPSQRRHVHYSLGRSETDPDNAISRASLIRGAGVTGHLINVLPPAALAGSARFWGETLAGRHGKGRQKWSVLATIALPLAVAAVVVMAVMVVVDNLIDAVDDACNPQAHWGVKAH